MFSAWHANAQAPSPTVDAAPADEVSRIPLDAPLLYELLLGEMTAAQGDAQDAVALLLDAAGKTNLQALYQRATEVALRARSGPLALRSARAWQQAFPQSRLANRYLLQILLMLNRVSDTGSSPSAKNWPPPRPAAKPPPTWPLPSSTAMPAIKSWPPPWWSKPCKPI